MNRLMNLILTYLKKSGLRWGLRAFCGQRPPGLQHHLPSCTPGLLCYRHRHPPGLQHQRSSMVHGKRIPLESFPLSSVLKIIFRKMILADHTVAVRPPGFRPSRKLYPFFLHMSSHRKTEKSYVFLCR